MAVTSTITNFSSTVLVRKLRQDELSSYKEFLLGLDEATRRNRFCSTVSQTFIRRYAQQTWSRGALVIGAFSAGQLCGIAELHPAGAPSVAEAAFAVRPEFRNRGIGASLLGAILLGAANRGYDRVRTVCLPSNIAMRQLARKAGAKLELAVDELKGEITPPRPTFITWLREVVSDIFDTPGYLCHACFRA